MSRLSPMAARVARAEAGLALHAAAHGRQLELFGRAQQPGLSRSAGPGLMAQVRRHPSDPARVRVFGNFAQVCAALEILCATTPGGLASPSPCSTP